jgi:asparagine synthase (glutamine-hydrolysing)
MCGIIGCFPKQDLSFGLDAIQNRGLDATNTQEVEGGILGHVLHAITGCTEQPIQQEGVLLFNGQIYNYKELAAQEGITVSSDTELLLYLLDTYTPKQVRQKLDGVYAYAYFRDNMLTLERDLLGVKPLWYSTNTGLAFASEKKALLAMGLSAREVHPRTTLTYDVKNNKLSASTRPLSFSHTSNDLLHVLREAVKKRIPNDGRVGVLFSGGVDSSLVAMIADQAGADVTLYVAALDDPEKNIPHDLVAAREAAKFLDLPLVEVRATLDEVQEVLPTICRLIEDSNVIKVGVALPFYFACKKAKEDQQRVLLSGLGAEEVFAGYNRHKQTGDINKECVRGLRKMFERDLYRDDVISMSQTLELRLPLLDYELISLGLQIPGEQKIIDSLTKVPLRSAAVSLGLDESIAFRKKRAAQYGSQFDAAIEKIAKKTNQSKSEYLKDLYPVNAKLCALLSSGKDSVYALYTMQKMNYEISVCATIQSENQDSYMYHTPAIELAKQQSESMGIPFISETTPGKKEVELQALKIILQRAINEYDIDGVVSGALFSDYQRSRIETICEELGLQVFAPLWHIDQEQEVREILDAGFIFVLSKVAAMGLDRTHVGRPITHEDIDEFTKKLGLNVAGEGGEYESLVLDGPNFSSPLTLEETSVICEQNGSVEVCELKIHRP